MRDNHQGMGTKERGKKSWRTSKQKRKGERMEKRRLKLRGMKAEKGKDEKQR